MSLNLSNRNFYCPFRCCFPLSRQATKTERFVTQKNTFQYGLWSVRYFGARCWNSILVDVKCSRSANSLHRKFEASFFENDYQALYIHLLNCTESLPTLEISITSINYFKTGGALSFISLATESAPSQEIPLYTVLLFSI